MSRPPAPAFSADDAEPRARDDDRGRDDEFGFGDGHGDGGVGGGGGARRDRGGGSFDPGPVMGLVRKDLLEFLTDRRAMLLSFAAPIALAAFIGLITSPRSSEDSPITGVSLRVVDRDDSEVTRRVIASLRRDDGLRVEVVDEDLARAEVRRGEATVAVRFPEGFADAAARALFGTGEPPEVTLWHDPSRLPETAMVRGVLVQYVMQAVGADVFNSTRGLQMVRDARKRVAEAKPDDLPLKDRLLLQTLLNATDAWFAGRLAEGEGGGEAGEDGTEASGTGMGFNLPFAPVETAIVGASEGSGARYNGYAHAFAGMSVQFLMFSALESALAMLHERRRGLWKRLRAAPVTKAQVLAARLLSASIVAGLVLAVTYAAAILVFEVRVGGSLAGFLLVGAATALMTASFGLMLAALGRSPEATRNVAVFAILIMVMVGGAWMPSFLFPSWLQTASRVAPPRWAIEGLEAMTWRAQPLSAAFAPALALLAFAGAFAAVAVWRFRWEERG